MEAKNNKRLSKFLSLILRHRPEVIGITLDESGWANVKELIEKMNATGDKISFETLNYIVETNAKKRFAFNPDKTKIRANQGHSITVDHNFKALTPPEFLFHGTGEQFVTSILKQGILKRQRHHVHLSLDKETAYKVGQRHGKPVILKIEALKMYEAGFSFYRSENNVWLTNYVPVEFIQH